MGNWNEEKLCTCALNSIFGYKPRISKALVDALGSASAVFGLGPEKISRVLGPYSRYAPSISSATLEKARKELDEAEDKGITFIGRKTEGFPALLEECEDTPAGIYVKGNLRLSKGNAERDCISFVGTREISEYGKEWCRKSIKAIADSGSRPVIVSGLAYGTDISAHLAALDCGLPTIAVMPCGLDLIYPRAHKMHGDRIAATEGCALVSDYPLGTSPLQINFLRRNRIIAGMSRTTVVIESKSRGGALITAKQAFSYDRDVMALPGRADDPCSAGCNMLIRCGIASPITSEKDLIHALGFRFRKSKDIRSEAESFYSRFLPDERIARMSEVLLEIKRSRSISIEELAERTGMEYPMAAEITSILENDGFITMDLLQRCSINVKKS